MITHYRLGGALAVAIPLLMVGVISLHQGLLAIARLGGASGVSTPSRTTVRGASALASIADETDVEELRASGTAKKAAEIMAIHHADWPRGEELDGPHVA